MTALGRFTAESSRAPGGTQSVQRAAMLLRIIASHNRTGLRVVDLCELTGLRRPTVHRLLQCLANEKLVTRNMRTRNYHLGQLLYELGVTAAPAIKLEDLCRSDIRALAEVTGDMAFLTLRSGLDAVCIDRQEGSFPIRTYTLEVGTRRPLGVGAGSLAILSALPGEQISEVVQQNRARLPAYNGLTAKELLRLVRQTQNRGFVVHDGSVSGARAVGVALIDATGSPFAALSVSAITARMQQTRWAEIVKLMRHHAQVIQKSIEENRTGGSANMTLARCARS